MADEGRKRGRENAQDISRLKSVEESLKIAVPQHIKGMKEGVADFDAVARSLSNINKEMETAIRLVQKLNNLSPQRQKEVGGISRRIKRLQNQMGSEETIGLFGGYQERQNRAANLAVQREKRYAESLNKSAQSRIKASGATGAARSLEEYQARFHSFAPTMAKHRSFIGNLPSEFEKTAGTKAADRQRDLASEFGYIKSGFDNFKSMFSKQNEKIFSSAINEWGDSVKEFSKQVDSYNATGMAGRDTKRKQRETESARKSEFYRKLSVANDTARYTPLIRSGSSYKERKSHFNYINDQIAVTEGIVPTSDKEIAERHKTLTSLQIQREHMKRSLGIRGRLADLNPYWEGAKDIFKVGKTLYDVPNTASNLFNQGMSRSQSALSWIQGTTAFGRMTGSSGGALRGFLNPSGVNKMGGGLFSQPQALRYLGQFNQSAPASYYKNLLKYQSHLFNSPLDALSGVPKDMMARFMGNMFLMGNTGNPQKVGDSLQSSVSNMMRNGLTSQQSLSLIRHSYNDLIGPGRSIKGPGTIGKYLSRLTDINPFYATQGGANFAVSSLQRGSETMANNPALFTLMLQQYPGLGHPGKARAAALRKLLGKPHDKIDAAQFRAMANEPNLAVLQQTLPNVFMSHTSHLLENQKRLANLIGKSELQKALLMVNTGTGGIREAIGLLHPELSMKKKLSNINNAPVKIEPGYTNGMQAYITSLNAPFLTQKSAYPSEDYTSALTAQARQGNLDLIASTKDFVSLIKATQEAMKGIERAMGIYSKAVEAGATHLGTALGARNPSVDTHNQAPR